MRSGGARGMRHGRHRRQHRGMKLVGRRRQHKCACSRTCYLQRTHYFRQMRSPPVARKACCRRSA
eukprot:1020690-Pelagomonas_calceolata.AAC.5